MMVTFARVGLPALALVLCVHGSALAQGSGNMPKPEEIQKQAKEFLARADTATTELEGLAKLTYKAIPSSTDEIGKQIGEQYKDKIPKGIDIDAAVKQFGPQIQEALNTYLSEPEGWKFEALVDLKFKSKKIPKGEYKVSLEVDGEQLMKVILTQGEAGKKGAVAISIQLAAEKKVQEPFAKLKFELKAVADKKTEKTTGINLHAEFFRTPSKTKEPLKVEPTKEPAKKDEKKEEGEKKEAK